MNPIQLTHADYNSLQELLANWRCTTAEQKGCHQALLQEVIRAKVVPTAEIDHDVITLSSRAQMTDLDSGELLEFTLVLPERADADAGYISILAPLGTAMLGFRKGDTFEWTMPGGPMRLRVDHVTQSTHAS